MKQDYESWDEDLKASLRDLAYAQMDTFQVRWWFLIRCAIFAFR